MQVFTLEIDGHPIFVFRAKNLDDARRICSDEALKADLCVLTSNSTPIYRFDSALDPRAATHDEINRFGAAILKAPEGEPAVVFLIDVDGAGH